MKYSAEEKAMWVEDWKESGLSSYAYAKKNGLNYQTFRNWVKGGKDEELVEIKPAPEDCKASAACPEMPQSCEAVIETLGIRIRLPVNALESCLSIIMKVLRPEACSLT
jgi:transposase-like protein